jgi:glycerol-3-phosphate dehydrogenase
LVQHEEVLHLEVLLRRRTNLMKLGEFTPELVVELALMLQKALGWSEEERVAEITCLLES